MYLGYVDDSGSNPQGPFHVIAAVLIADGNFSNIEVEAGIVVQNLIPLDRLETFQEFHASDFFGGHGVFEGIDEAVRFSAIRQLLRPLKKYRLPVMYGAVNRGRLTEAGRASVITSANMAFRACLPGIEEWMNDKDMAEMCLLIMDDNISHRALRKQLKKSYKEMRRPLRPPRKTRGDLWRFHDEMYFGESRDSIGIQLADLCAYFICRHLRGEMTGREFYEIVSHRIKHKSEVPDESDASKL